MVRLSDAGTSWLRPPSRTPPEWGIFVFVKLRADEWPISTRRLSPSSLFLTQKMGSETKERVGELKELANENDKDKKIDPELFCGPEMVDERGDWKKEEGDGDVELLH